MQGNTRQITLILKQVKMLQSELENTKMIYDNYNKSNNILKPMDTTRESLSKSYNNTSATETLALYLADYKESIDKLQIQLNVIEVALKCLSERERKVIEKKYIEGKKWSEVAFEVELCEKWCKEIKNQAYKKLVRVIPVEIFPSIFFD